MTRLLLPPDGPPDGRPDWPALRAAHDWVDALYHTPQDPIWHAEGDVGIHTEMVIDALVDAPDWPDLDDHARAVTWLACLLHDVAKPQTTRTEDDGRITARGHSHKGAVAARRIMWRLGVPFAIREEVCAIIAVHQMPFFAIDKPDVRDRAMLASTALCNASLARVAEADIRGRTCQDASGLIDNIELYRMLCAELGCLDAPYPYPSDHARFLHATAERAPIVAPHEDFTCTATLLCGLPGAGKDHWLRHHYGGWPTVSLDAIRQRLGVAPGDHHGTVIQTAKETAREHLRAGRDFAWNGTHLTRRRRAQLIELFARYGARIRIVYVEADPATQRRRNRSRDAAVPDAVIEDMLAKWEVPTLLEAHTVEWVSSDGTPLEQG